MCQGSREALERYKLTKRPYLGTTSMDTELAFLMASQAQVMVGPDVCLLVMHGPNPMLLVCAPRHCRPDRVPSSSIRSSGPVTPVANKCFWTLARH